MHELGRRPAKGVEEHLVQRRRRNPLLAAQDVRDLHQVIVHHHGQVIGRQPVALEQHRVHDAGVLHGDVAADDVVHGRRARQRRRKADDGRPALGFEGGALLRRQSAMAPVVGQVARSQFLQLLGSGVAAVGVAVLDQPVGILAVGFLALALDVGRVRAADVGAFVPLQPKPTQAAHEILETLRVVALLVGILDAQDELAARVVGKEPVE